MHGYQIKDNLIASRALRVSEFINERRQTVRAQTSTRETGQFVYELPTRSFRRGRERSGYGDKAVGSETEPGYVVRRSTRPTDLSRESILNIYKRIGSRQFIWRHIARGHNYFGPFDFT